MEKNKIKLYKYVSNVKYLKESYCKQEIWLTPINALNDPFEGHTKTKQFSPEFIELNSEIFDMIYEEVKKKHKKLTIEEFKKSIQEPSFNTGLAEFESKIRRLFNEHGITSFTIDPRNIPMWTYYANNHHGYCVEFEMDFNIVQKATRMPVAKTEELIKDRLCCLAQ